MTIFISGGCKNGKSSIAEDACVKLAKGGPLYYVATMQAFDDEDRARIKRHVESRDGKGFETIEQPKNILQVLDKCDASEGTFLLDSVTALMINELYSASEAMGEETYDMSSDKNAAARVCGQLEELCKKAKNIVFVSDYIYQERDDYSEYTLEFLEALSTVDRKLAQLCDTVCEVAFGNTDIYKGELPV